MGWVGVVTLPLPMSALTATKPSPPGDPPPSPFPSPSPPPSTLNESLCQTILLTLNQHLPPPPPFTHFLSPFIAHPPTPCSPTFFLPPSSTPFHPHLPTHPLPLQAVDEDGVGVLPPWRFLIHGRAQNTRERPRPTRYTSQLISQLVS